MAQKLTPARKHAADIYRPGGAVLVSNTSGLAFAAGAGAAAGFQAAPINNIDLTLPIRGFRFIITGRITIATANYTSVNPENILNLVSNILISGTNTRQGGNVTLLNMDLATLWGLGMLTGFQNNSITVNDVLIARPGMPYQSTPIVALTTAGSPYDFRISVDVPFAPFGSTGILGPVQSGFVCRKGEWGNSLSITFTFPSVADNAANPLGTSAATTTTAISAIGGSTGAMNVEVLSLPVRLGGHRANIVPGVMARVVSPISTILQTTGNPVQLFKLQHQSTPRVYAKIGVGTASPVFTSLNDKIVTQIGLQKGNGSNIKNLLDSYAYKFEVANEYQVGPIQGYYALDFIPTGNPDGAYQAQDDTVLGDGSDWYLMAAVTGTANGQGLVIQEQVLQLPG